MQVATACLVPTSPNDLGGLQLFAAEVVAGAGGPDLYRFRLSGSLPDLWLYRDTAGRWRFAVPVRGMAVVPQVTRPSITALEQTVAFDPASAVG
ncbi:hypothetical protein SAMN06265365_14815 [Tistlia consotensis]|uniref:Uncharacterized protein n=1 Tax=Tistlia consotensis USBA 355 TaxID=560819 RepID=A0A1Y6CR95_9PROT|nr:hypothetical protein [Tistlia consotensis]SMF82881.1 hypothetical protein SAMN05428998_14816 [Tistlia consotensis USBA 355]SNS31273.1 hypothetical protein SAMN06265365_14815 [Tistlia consotensis]